MRKRGRRADHVAQLSRSADSIPSRSPGPYEVEVHTGSGPSVSAKGPEKMIDHLVVEVKGDKLMIHPEEQRGFFHMGWHFNGTVHVEVTVPQLAARRLPDRATSTSTK